MVSERCGKLRGNRARAHSSAQPAPAAVNNGADPSNKLYSNSIVLDMERLVRRILDLPRRPAVVLMHVPTTGMANYPHGHPKNPNNEPWA